MFDWFYKICICRDFRELFLEVFVFFWFEINVTMTTMAWSYLAEGKSFSQRPCPPFSYR